VTDDSAAEPGKGYAEKAAEWGAKLDELGTEALRHEGTEGKGETPESQNAETAKPQSDPD